MPEQRTIMGIGFNVWQTSFAVYTPFAGPVIQVGRERFLEAGLKTVALTVLLAMKYQHEADKKALTLENTFPFSI